MKKLIYPLIASLAVFGCSSVSNQSSGQALSTMSQNTLEKPSKASRFSPVGILNGITKKDFNAKYDVAYGQQPRQMLDIYTPLAQAPNHKLKPVIVFVYGGAWTSGSKNDYLFVGESFTKAGYVTVVIDYRLAPQHKYPDYVQDTALAFKWVNENIAQYGGDPKQVIAMGHSAGAFNVVEAIDNKRWLDEVKVPVSNIKAVVGIAGPYSYDFRTDGSFTAFPADSTPDQVMPDRHVRADAPPHLLLTGSSDKRVKLLNTQKMYAALQQQKIPVQHAVIDGAGHMSIMGSIASRLNWYKPTRQVILDYLDTVLKTDPKINNPKNN